MSCTAGYSFSWWQNNKKRIQDLLHLRSHVVGVAFPSWYNLCKCTLTNAFRRVRRLHLWPFFLFFFLSPCLVGSHMPTSEDYFISISGEWMLFAYQPVQCAAKDYTPPPPPPTHTHIHACSTPVSPPPPPPAPSITDPHLSVHPETAVFSSHPTKLPALPPLSLYLDTIPPPPLPPPPAPTPLLISLSLSV